MRLLFTSFPAIGHFHPLVPLAEAARAAGHEVLVASGPNIVEWASHCGLDAHSVGLSEDEAAEIADRDFSGPDRTARMFTDVWVGTAIADLVALAETWRPDVVVHEEEEYAGVLLAAILDVPCVTQSWSAPARPVAGQQLALEMLAAVWQRYLPGVAPRRVGQHYLDACPEQFQTDSVAPIADSARIVPVQPGLFDGPRVEPPSFVTSITRPAAYVTLGTVAVFSRPQLLADIARGLSPLMQSVVVTTGPNPVDSLGPLPGNVFADRYLRQSLVLPHVDLMVSHGGAGGTIGAVMQGLPHLVLPGHGTSQQTIAAAVERVGVGVRLADDRSPEAVRGAASTLLQHPSYAAAARAVAGSLALRATPADAVNQLERLVR